MAQSHQEGHPSVFRKPLCCKLPIDSLVLGKIAQPKYQALVPMLWTSDKTKQKEHY